MAWQQLLHPHQGSSINIIMAPSAIVTSSYVKACTWWGGRLTDADVEDHAGLDGGGVLSGELVVRLTDFCAHAPADVLWELSHQMTLLCILPPTQHTTAQ